MIIKKTTGQQQAKIHAGEAFYTWEHLVYRYEAHELLDIFQNFASDTDFKTIIATVLRTVKQDIAQIEDELNTFGIPLPLRPPKSINSPANTEVLRDEFMFRVILRQFQSFINEHARTSITIRSRPLRKLFYTMNLQEIKDYSRLASYGELKGWTPVPPSYKMSKA